jgi:hypothetical protein
MAKYAGVISLLLNLILIGSASYGSTPGRVLMQESQAVGPVTVTYSRLGISVLLRKTGLVCLWKPPAWQAILYNPEKGVGYKTNRTLLSGDKLLPMVMAFQSGKFIHLEQTKSEITTLEGVRVKHVQYKSAIPVDTPQSKTEKETKKARRELLARSGEAWLIEDKSVTPEVASTLSSFFMLPKPNGVPFKFVFVDAPGHPRVWIRTLAWKDISCDESKFQPPKNLKFVKKSEEVCFPTSELKDIINSFGAM